MKNIYLMTSFFLAFFLLTSSCTKDALQTPVNKKSAAVVEPATAEIINPLPTDDFKVVGYVTNWSGTVNEIQFDKLTHINYAFLLPTVTGDILPVENVLKLLEIVKVAHSKNVKVLASVGGYNYGDDSGFRSISRNDAYRKAFAQKLLSVIQLYDLDGVDIDWETPKVGETDGAYTLLMKELSATIRSKGKLVTAAVPAQNCAEIQSEVFNYVDFLNIMAYDSFIDDNNHSPVSLAVSALSYWKARGLPKSKTVLGMPFYGRARKGWNFTSYVLFKDLLDTGAGPFNDLYKKTGYNGITTIKVKTLLALGSASGVMIWELAGDAKGDKSLLTAIDQTITGRR